MVWNSEKDYPLHIVITTQTRENGAVNGVKCETGVFCPSFTSARNMTKIGGENSGRLLEKKTARKMG
jgi:hypothetical protein